MKDTDTQWEDLKVKVQELIDLLLREEMVMEAQRIKLEYGEKSSKFLVANFWEIWKSWNMGGSIENCEKINQITYSISYPKRNIGYRYYLKSKIMK